ncbi:MAG: glycosyltransferase family 2 protein [Saprospiraceae bacterium]|nr:glycosyltransferase family 2 protein [Saprospiraceae bacterium]MCB9308814.1 glycosyltransferase family 2 protein [Lewinellaceae bacterium]
MDVSFVIPLLNEEESLNELHNWIVSVVEAQKYSYEIIFIDDGSTDQSWSVIQDLHAKNPHVKGIKFRRNYGKSAGLNSGFSVAQGNIVITMDADLQDNPEEVPEMIEMIQTQGFHIVSGWKKKRYDPLSKTIPTKIYNYVTSKMSGVHLHDMNCGLKAYQSKVVKNIEVYGEMHRYIPVIAKWAGFNKIGEKVVKHQARKYGSTKFGLSRFIYGPLDLATIMFMGKFSKRPMHFFGVLGTFIFIIGLLLLTYLSIDKIINHTYGIANRPAFYLGILMAIIGIQLFIAGFLGEMISRTAPERNEYIIEDHI